MTEHEHELPRRDFEPENGSTDSSEPPAPVSDTAEISADMSSDEPEVPLPADQTAETDDDIESLTLADVVGRLFRRPGAAIRLLIRVVEMPADDANIDEANEVEGDQDRSIDEDLRAAASPRFAETPKPARPTPETRVPHETPASSPPPAGIVRGDGTITLTITLPVPDVDLEIPSVEPVPQTARGWVTAQFVLRLCGFVSALWGGWILLQAPVQGESERLPEVAPFWLFGMLLWLIAEVFEWTPRLRELRSTLQPRRLITVMERTHAGNNAQLLVFRLIMGGITLVMMYIAIVGTSGNFVTTIGFFGWIASMIAVSWTFAPRGWTPIKMVRDIARWVRGWRIKLNWVTLGLIGVLIVGGYFRFSALDTPPEMTSDHVEKIINAQEILDGQPRVFFTNNGGREPMQMYLMALLSEVPLPGLGINFYTLKLLTAIEGFITLPVIFWLGRALFGAVDRKLGDLVGLASSGLVAVSYWHEILSHLGLRIVLTCFVIALLLVFFVRGLRTNSRSQFVLAGLTLGIGMYTYQAVRMAPLFVVIGLVIGLLYRLRDGKAARKLIANGVVLVVVAGVCFVPMYGFAREFPESFNERTLTRVFGDEASNAITSQNDLFGQIRVLIQHLPDVLPQFQINMRNAFLGYNFNGDGAWFQSAPHHPFMDAVTGGFLLVGLIAFIMLLFRKRDPGFDLWLPMIVIMMLSSALAIAFPDENPSATRISGTLPGVYILAGYGLVLLAQVTARVIARRRGFIVGSAVSVGLIYWAYTLNVKTFVVDYRTEYENSHYVYSEPGQNLRQFVDTGGAWGNAFIIFYPYWWDHRAVAIEAGNIRWPNAIAQDAEPNRDHVPEALRDGYLRTDEFHFDPNKPMLFFYGDQDTETGDLLLRWFPNGTMTRHPTYQHNDNDPYRTFYVPALGEARFRQWLADNGSPLP